MLVALEVYVHRFGSRISAALDIGQRSTTPGRNVGPALRLSGAAEEGSGLVAPAPRRDGTR